MGELFEQQKLFSIGYKYSTIYIYVHCTSIAKFIMDDYKLLGKVCGTVYKMMSCVRLRQCLHGDHLQTCSLARL